jgi:lysophospholipase L1-like esterase
MKRTAVISIFACALALHAQTGQRWVATWGTAQQAYRAGVGGRGPATPGPSPASVTKAPAPPQPAPPANIGPQRRFPVPPGLAALTNQTVRMIARVSLGGRSVRVRFSNAFGATAVNIGAAHIALREKDSAIVPGSDRALTFSGKPTATLYGGATLVSDAVNLTLAPLAEVAVSLYVTGENAAPAAHTFALHTTYISAEGDFAGAPSISAAATRESYYWLAGIDVLAPANAGTVVTLGDSITDGDQSTPETNGAWPSILAARLQANKATAHLGVVNAGISGNTVRGDNSSALSRYYHDVLSVPGIRWITLLEGINDITRATRQNPTAPPLTAEDLIASYRQLIEIAHLHGVKIAGCTITPFGGSNVYTDAGEALRTAVNDWIRTGGAFDAVIDFDAATRDPQNPKRFRAEADSPDLLHPANPGYKLMGEAVPTAIFTGGAARPAAKK